MVDAMSSGRTEIFYSKSKDKADLGKGIPRTWRKQLSNFWPVEVTIDGRTYPSVEAAFQAAKAMHSSKPEMALKFEVGGSVGPDPADAKREGTKQAYRAAGAVLQAAKWDAARDRAMMNALQARYAVDEEFRKILEATKELDVRLVHYERAAAKAYWGGAVKEGQVLGQNKLGKMLMAMREGGAMQEGEGGPAAAGAAPPSPAGSPVAGAAVAAAPVAPVPSMAVMGRVSDSVTAISHTRKVFTARATLLAQLGLLGYKVSHLQGASPAEIDRQIQSQELNFVVTPTATSIPGKVHVRFHIDKALRQVHIQTLADELRESPDFDVKRDALVLVSKDLPNDSVKAAVSSVWAKDNAYIVVRALAELQFDVTRHRDVPSHYVLPPDALATFMQRVRLGPGGLGNLPGISRFDPVARAILMRPGQVCEILRPSQSAGTYHYYRVCE
jgi:ribA/ribD-fused uncharacterized protein